MKIKCKWRSNHQEPSFPKSSALNFKGCRVKVWGYLPGQSTYYNGVRATVIAVSDSNVCTIEFDNYKVAQVYTQQIRKVKKITNLDPVKSCISKVEKIFKAVNKEKNQKRT